MTAKTALVLTGGGARGAYQIGVLKALAERVPKGTMPFSVITGTSVGAINAALLASYPDDFAAGVERLEDIWRTLHCANVFRTENAAVRGRLFAWARAAFLGWGAGAAPSSILDNDPLRELVERHVDFETVNGVGKDDGTLRAIALTTSSYLSERSVTFFAGDPRIAPWRRTNREGLRGTLSTDHVLASSALPFVFPAVKIGEEYYGDGALRSVAPLADAIHLGADRLLVIGVRDKMPQPDRSAPQAYPPIGNLAGQMLDILFLDHLDNDLERLQRINQLLAGRSHPGPGGEILRPVDVLTVDPSVDLRPLAGDAVADLPGSVRLLLRTIGALKPPYVLPSFLAFEPGYTHALIELGHRDGRASFANGTDVFGAASPAAA